MSSLEEHVYNILIERHIDFEREKSFKDLRNNNYRFDFFLPQQNLIIELDGRQHFEYIPYFHKNQQNFLKSQERDRRKNSYCLANKIPLYRIPYWEIDNIKTLEDIFKEKFLVRSKWHNDNLKHH